MDYELRPSTLLSSQEKERSSKALTLRISQGSTLIQSQSFTHSFYKYLWNKEHLLGTVQGTRDTTINKMFIHFSMNSIGAKKGDASNLILDCSDMTPFKPSCWILFFLCWKSDWQHLLKGPPKKGPSTYLLFLQHFSTAQLTSLVDI